MRRLGFTLVAALAFSVSAFANNANDTINVAGKWDGTINKAKLTKYLQLSSQQNEQVASICDYFQEQMKVANSSKKNSDQKVRNAVYGNLKLMKNTLTENGHVARGVCVADENNHLVQIDERTKIIKTATGAAYSEDDGQTWVETDPDGVVSMNFWGFSSKLIQDLVDGFPAFLEENVPKNPMKCEYLLPATVGQLMKAGKLTVNVLQSTDKWHGVTYKEDKPEVMKAIQELKDQGLYPQGVWAE